MNSDELSGFTDIWKDAKIIHDQLNEMTDLESGTLFANSHNYNYIQETLGIFNESADLIDACQNLNKHLHADFGISNIGLIF